MCLCVFVPAVTLRLQLNRDWQVADTHVAACCACFVCAVCTCVLLCCLHLSTLPQIMAGQGTVAVELLQQLPQGVDAVIVPVGGGGLIGGIAAVLKAWRPDVQVRMVFNLGAFVRCGVAQGGASDSWCPCCRCLLY